MSDAETKPPETVVVVKKEGGCLGGCTGCLILCVIIILLPLVLAIVFKVAVFVTLLGSIPIIGEMIREFAGR